MKHTIIDLFAGAGGLTTGFHLAGFQSLCAIEIESKSIATYRYNYPSTDILNQDIRQVDPSELKSYLKLKKEQLTVLAGGPPCQGFSKNVPANCRSLNDPRNQLHQAFLNFVHVFRPLFVVIENVPEILNAYSGAIRHEITERLEREGYHVISASLNAANFGVPQTRSRAFFIASLMGKPQLPEPTHTDKNYDRDSNASQLTLPNFSSSPFITVKDAIGDLPPLMAGQEYTEETYPLLPHTSYQAALRHGSTKLVNHIARALSPIQMARAQSLQEGQDARDLPPELAPKKYYSGAYGRLHWNRPAKTITRWVFHPGSGRFFHPEQNRTITIREAARLHSYPDNFHFVGTYTEMASQIGESVPPLLAKTVGLEILRQCE